MSALCSSEEQELKEDLGSDYWIKVWDECSSGDSLIDGWSDDSPCDSGTGAQHEFYTDTGWRSDHWKRDSWHSSRWRTTDCHRKDESYHGCDGTWSKHHVYDGWNSSHWKTTGWDQENERRHDHVESQWFTHAFFEALSVDQLINSLHRGEGDTTIFTGLEVDPGESLADTAAQSVIIDLRPFRKAEEALFYKFGLKPRVIYGNNQAVGIGGKAKVLGKVEMPSGMGGVNGVVKHTVVDSPGVPPLTPVSLLKHVGAVIDLNNNTMELKKIGTTTALRILPTGHVAHKLTEFASGGWKAPTPEQTKLFQARSDVFRPLTLPGESKQRRQYQKWSRIHGLKSFSRVSAFQHLCL